MIGRGQRVFERRAAVSGEGRRSENGAFEGAKEFVLSKLAGPGRYYLWIKTPYFISNNLNHRGADKTAD
jgi:hypothetical protein